MSDFTPNPLFAFGRVDTSAGEGGESLHKVNPALFGVDAEGHIGRGAEVDGEATPEDVALANSPVGNVPEPPEGTVVEPTFAPEGGTVDTGPGAPPADPEIAEGDVEGSLEEGEANGEAQPGEPSDGSVPAPVEGEANGEAQPGEPSDGSVPAPVEGEGEQAPADPVVDPVDYESMLKADLVALANERGIDSSGTKAEIIERLQIADAAA